MTGNDTLNTEEMTACQENCIQEEQKSDEIKPDEAKPDEAKPDEAKPDEAKPEETKPEETKQEGYIQEKNKESTEDEHRKRIENQLERAKKKEAYETYGCELSEEGNLRTFIARRMGKSHVKDKTSCQDYCLTYVTDTCTILADADGVGSCELSDVGARLACEAVVSVVKSALGSGIEEEELVSRLLSVTFRERLVSFWVKSVMDTIPNMTGLTPEKQMEEFHKYGTTLMYAVITKKWIVAGNIGDGQILAFNDSFGINLRMHGTKQGTKVVSLLGEKCAREDFQVAKYPRDVFDGILLSTDGMYDCLNVGDLFFQYAIQLKNRFLEKGEPFQPFCFLEKGEPYKDFSRMRTFDDCSIAMALDVSSKKTDNYDAVCDSIRGRGVNKLLISRWSANCMYFFAMKEKQSLDILASMSSPALISDLKTAVLEKPIGEWSVEGMYYSEYNYNGLSALELMFSSGQLKIKRSDAEGSKKRVWDIYNRLVKLQNELKDLGFDFNSSAGFNIFVDESNLALHIRREAVSEVESNPKKTYSSGINRYFDILLGVLASENTEIPIFDIGYVSRGAKQNDQNGNPLFQIVNEDKALFIKNISTSEWKRDGGEVIKPGELLELKNETSFSIFDEKGRESEKYVYSKRIVLN